MILAQPIARQKRRTRAEIRQLVEEFLRSGVSELEFCDSRGLSRSTLYRHLKQQAKKAAPGPISANPQLVRVELAGGKRCVASNGGGLVVVLANGCKIEVAAGFDGLTLERLVRVLEQL
jgi:hypothetical protein